MSEQILVPVLGESITEATIAKWLKNVGDTVEADEPVVELETDKVNLEVPSPISGTIGDIKFKDGDVVKVGTVLGSVKKNNQKINKEIEKTESDIENNNVVNLEKKIKVFDKEENLEEEEQPLILDEEEQPLILTEEIKQKEESKILSPSVRKIVAEKKIDVASIKGTGKDGRISKGDLINLMGNI